ncbi:glutamyl-tRNA amidotransferase subunit A [Ustulina deusta]|nr:glutamyl-tRNA amidotransferase subunit A [Ustulina deusta]
MLAAGLKSLRLQEILATASAPLINSLRSLTFSYQPLPTSNGHLPSPYPRHDRALQTKATRLLRSVMGFVLLLLIIGGISAIFIRPVLSSGTSYPLLREASIESLAAGLDSNTFTSVDLVKAYLARIQEVNQTVHAVTEINPDALEIAAALDKERASGSLRSRLHGIPILVKNNMGTLDSMETTAGSWALVGSRLPSDATVVQKLRSAGVIIIGKTSITQWANFRSLNASNGWSALGGQVFGPFYPKQDPWGSSSGSAVAATLGLAVGALGTETDGSITGPASFNDVVGMKPTVGLTSRHLVIPVSEHQDTVGSLTRTVKDAAYILQAIAGVDPHDNYTSAIPDLEVPDYVAACNLSAISGLRLGVPRNVIDLFSDNTTTSMIERFEDALDVLRSAGAIIVNTTFPAALEQRHSNIPMRVMSADFVVNLKTYLESLVVNPNNITSLADLREFTQAFPLEDYPERDTTIWDAALESWNNTDPRFWPVYQEGIYFGDEGGLLGAIRRDLLDAVVLPANFASDAAATVGAPIVTVPLGFYPENSPISKNSWDLIDVAARIPFGISFLGNKFTEEKLISIAYAFEQMTKVKDSFQPYILPTTELYDVI